MVEAAERARRIAVRPTLVIGVGGTGWKIVRGVKEQIFRQYGEVPDQIQFRAIEVDTNDLNQADIRARFAPGELIRLSTAITASTVASLERSNPRVHDWWLYPYDPRMSSNGCHAIRAAGRLVFALSTGTVRDSIVTALNRAMALDQAVDAFAGNPKVVIVGSICGGTGSGMILDLAYFIRHLADQEYPGTQLSITSYLLTPEALMQEPNVRATIADKVMANAYAFLLELDNLNRSPSFNAHYSGGLEISNQAVPPFNVCYLIGRANQAGAVDSLDRILDMTSDAVVLEVISPIAGNNASVLDNPEVLDSFATVDGIPDPHGIYKRSQRYSSMCVTSLYYPGKDIRRIGTHWAAEWLRTNHFLNQPVDLLQIVAQQTADALLRSGLTAPNGERIPAAFAVECPRLGISSGLPQAKPKDVLPLVRERADYALNQLARRKADLADAGQSAAQGWWEQVAQALNTSVKQHGLVVSSRLGESLIEQLVAWAEADEETADTERRAAALAKARLGYSLDASTAKKDDAPLSHYGQLEEALRGGWLTGPRMNRVSEAATKLEDGFDLWLRHDFEAEARAQSAAALRLLADWVNGVRDDLERAREAFEAVGDDWSGDIPAMVEEFTGERIDPFAINVLCLPDPDRSLARENAEKAITTLLNRHRLDRLTMPPLLAETFWDDYCALRGNEPFNRTAPFTPIDRLQPDPENEADQPARRLEDHLLGYCDRWAAPLATLDLLDAADRAGVNLSNALQVVFNRADALWTLDNAKRTGTQKDLVTIQIVGVGSRSWQQRIQQAAGFNVNAVVTNDRQSLTVFVSKHGATARMLSFLSPTGDYNRHYRQRLDSFELDRQRFEAGGRQQLNALATPVHTANRWLHNLEGALLPFDPQVPTEDERLRYGGVFFAALALGYVRQDDEQHFSYRRVENGQTTWAPLNTAGAVLGLRGALDSFLGNPRAQQQVKALVAQRFSDDLVGAASTVQEDVRQLRERARETLAATGRDDAQLKDRLAMLDAFRQAGIPDATPSAPGPLWQERDTGLARALSPEEMDEANAVFAAALALNLVVEGPGASYGYRPPRARASAQLQILNPPPNAPGPLAAWNAYLNNRAAMDDLKQVVSLALQRDRRATVDALEAKLNALCEEAKQDAQRGRAEDPLTQQMIGSLATLREEGLSGDVPIRGPLW